MRVDTLTMLQPESVDRIATRRRVEWVLEQVRIFKMREQVRLLSDVSASFPHTMGSRNQIHEGTAVYRTADDRLGQICDKVEQALACLDNPEKELITRRYLSKDSSYDFLLCHDLKLSERTYRRIKARAIGKLAYILGLEVEGRQRSS